jgi:hypothetical protein
MNYGLPISGNGRTAAAAWGVVLAALMATPAVRTAAPHFYKDDPIAREPETQDASGAQPWDIGLMYELATNLFVTANYTPSNTRAQNINTIDEVPDSSWFTNRIGAAPISDQALTRGPAVGTPPAPERWTILREKSAGVNPGFTAKDANGETWFIGFDHPDRPEAASAAVVIASKLFWALGYNQVEMFITTFDPAKAEIDPKATKKRPSGDRTPFTRSDLMEVLDRVARNPDGTYRVAAGRLLTGKVLGGFRYTGTRPDDPNDVVPHEHRRELRALRVFGAWTNLTDMKAGNTLDTVVTENGRATVRHVLQDVGSTFGTANGIHEWDLGWEYFYEAEPSRKRLMTFGFGLSPWQTVPYTEYPSIGRFEGDRFDPRAWRPQTPTTAYMEMRDDDAFWAARRVMAFSDDLLRAAVRTGQFSDPAAERHLGAVLIKRRDAIGRSYLSAVNPIVDLQLRADSTLTFANAAVDGRFAEAPAGYHAEWKTFDNATGETRPIAATDSRTTTIAAPPAVGQTAQGGFIAVDVSADSPAHPSWREPAHAFFRRTDNGWKLVGFERMPERPAASRPATR